MGGVAAAAFTVGVWFMWDLIFFFQFCMARKAIFSKIAGDKAFFATCMRGVTDTALSFGDGIMDNSRAELFLALTVTGVTEHSLLLTKQALVPGHMRVVADTALGFKYRLMGDSIREEFFVVALKTDSSIYGGSGPAHKEKWQQG